MMKQRKSRGRRGRIPIEFGLYSMTTQDKIVFLRQKIKRMKQGVPAKEIAVDEIKEVCEKYPHMRGIYDDLTKKSYTKMLRNRISALKSRTKKKAEELELTTLREMARRIYLLQKNEVLSERVYELLKIESDDDFKAVLRVLKVPPNQQNIVCPKPDQFMPDK